MKTSDCFLFLCSIVSLLPFNQRQFGIAAITQTVQRRVLAIIIQTFMDDIKNTPLRGLRWQSTKTKDYSFVPFLPQFFLPFNFVVVNNRSSVKLCSISNRFTAFSFVTDRPNSFVLSSTTSQKLLEKVEKVTYFLLFLCGHVSHQRQIFRIVYHQESSKRIACVSIEH